MHKIHKEKTKYKSLKINILFPYAYCAQVFEITFNQIQYQVDTTNLGHA